MLEFMPAWEYASQLSACPSMRAHMHADVSGQWCISVVLLRVSAHPKVFEFLCGQVRVCVLLCFWMYVNNVSALQASAPYLALAAGGVQQVPNCCRPHNGFYKPRAGTGLWLSCRLGSPPLYPCHLRWRSSQSVKRKQIRVQLWWSLEITGRFNKEDWKMTKGKTKKNKYARLVAKKKFKMTQRFAIWIFTGNPSYLIETIVKSQPNRWVKPAIFFKH